jgi:hypothetical protein
LNEEGITLTGGIDVSQGSTVTVEVRLLHSSGEWIASTASATAKDGGAQALGSVTTYLRRYLTQTICGIASDDDDDGEAAEGRTRQYAPPPQQPAKPAQQQKVDIEDIRPKQVAAPAVKSSPADTQRLALELLAGHGVKGDEAHAIIKTVLGRGGLKGIEDVRDPKRFLSFLADYAKSQSIPNVGSTAFKLPSNATPEVIAAYIAKRTRPSHMSLADATSHVLNQLTASVDFTVPMDDDAKKLMAETYIETGVEYPPAQQAKFD